MKIAALDIGDAWTGIALSDPLHILARPYHTIAAKDLYKYIPLLLNKEPIETIVIGYPKTMRGTQSDQTKKIIQIKEKLAIDFPAVSWVLWDERLSSKRASSVQKARTKEEKLKSHAIAAAFILESYLTYKNSLQNTQ